MSEFVKWFLVGFLALASLLSISSVGKPRKPTTGGEAATAVFLNALMAVLIVVFWGVS